MRTIQSVLAVYCVALMLAPAAIAQEFRYSWQERQHHWLFDPYKAKTIDPINLSNSDRLEALLRAGNLYLSLQDAIALAIENNLAVEVARYGPQIAEADMLRASAGGLLRGVPQTVQTGTASVEAQVLGGATGAAGGSAVSTRRSGGAGSEAVTEAGGAIITTTGTALPNLDPQMFGRYAFTHRSSPVANTITTGGVTALAFDTHSWNYGVQKEWLTGTQVQFGWNSSWFENNNPSNLLNPSWDGNFQLRVTQPLLRGFGLAVNNRNIRIARNNLQVSSLVFEQQVITTVASIIKLYWDLVSFREDVNVKKQALALAEKLYSDNKKQVEIGTLAPIEIVSAEAQVARRQQELTVSETRLLQQETVLKDALSKTGVASPSLAAARVIPTDSLPEPAAEEVPSLADLEKLVDSALANRPEVARTRINIENTQIGMAGSQSQLKPSLEASMFFNNNALAGQENPLLNPASPFRPDPFFVGGYGTILGQLFRRNFPDYGISATLIIPIKNRSAQADYIRDSLQLRQQELQERQQLNSIRVQVQNAMIALQQAKALHDTSVKERILQEETLQAEQKKYALGASTVFFVIQYQRDLAQAQANEVAARANYAAAQVDLKQATGELLDDYRISIGEAKAGRISQPPAALPPAP